MGHLNIHATDDNGLAVISYGSGFRVVRLSSKYRVGYCGISSTYSTIEEAVALMNKLHA